MECIKFKFFIVSTAPSPSKWGYYGIKKLKAELAANYKRQCTDQDTKYTNAYIHTQGKNLYLYCLACDWSISAAREQVNQHSGSIIEY